MVSMESDYTCFRADHGADRTMHSVVPLLQLRTDIRSSDDIAPLPKCCDDQGTPKLITTGIIKVSTKDWQK